MDKFEKAEKIVAKTGVSFEDAKEALDMNDGDMLDAIVYLEKAGKVQGPKMSSYTTVPEVNEPKAEYTYERKTNTSGTTERSSFGKAIDELVEISKKLFKKSIDNQFVISKKDGGSFKVPILVLIVALIIALPVTLIALFVGLCCDCRYDIEKKESSNVEVPVSVKSDDKPEMTAEFLTGSVDIDNK